MVCSGCILFKNSHHGVNVMSTLALTLLAQLCALVQGRGQPSGGPSYSKIHGSAARASGTSWDQDVFTVERLEPGPRMSLSGRERESRHSAEGGCAKGHL